MIRIALWEVSLIYGCSLLRFFLENQSIGNFYALLKYMPSAMSSTDIEKPPSVERIEDIDKPEIHDVDYDEEFTPAEQRKIIHRVDRRLVTMAGLAYCISLMDRTNLSMAAVAG